MVGIAIDLCNKLFQRVNAIAQFASFSTMVVGDSEQPQPLALLFAIDRRLNVHRFTQGNQIVPHVERFQDLEQPSASVFATTHSLFVKRVVFWMSRQLEHILGQR